MKLQFLGAARTVTGSRFLLSHGKSKILIDCGLFQGFKNLRLMNWEPFPIDPKDLDAVVLTHAHLDHSGSIPLLVKGGFRGPIYATSATIDLCEILLPDSGFLQEEEARFANKRGYSKHSPAQPLYTVQDAQASLAFFRAVDWNQPIRIAKNGLGTFEVRLFPAGHLLGAASVHIQADGQTIAFSGDLGRRTDPMIREPDLRMGADHLVVESTYGNRTHPTTDPAEQLREIILRTYERKGILLIPSFAIGRAQLILYYISQLKSTGAIPREIPVFLNSPMATEASRAFAGHVGELKLSRTEFIDIWKGVQVIGKPEESIALNESAEPSIIIAASGMATGGRVLHHLKSLAPGPQNTILFVGFQAGGTRGDLMVRGAEEIKIHGQYWPVRAEVANMDTLSAHADADEIMTWISRLEKKPRRIFITHGEPEAAEALQRRIEQELEVTAIVPDHLQEFELE